MKKPFSTPKLETLGTISQLTGTGCIDIGIDPDKNLGWPDDDVYRFIPTCDDSKNNPTS
jgi:hypothetical protein